MSYYLGRKMIRKLPGDVIKEVPLPEPRVTEGFGKRVLAAEYCRTYGYRSVLLVTDPTLLSLGFHTCICEALGKAGIACTVFSDVASEPTTEIVQKGRETALSCSAECVIALGGGSVLDSSKIIAASVIHGHRELGHYLTKFVFEKTLPMITIPSTAGTGAEITVGAVVKNARGTKKASVIVGLKVTDVILDSELTLKLPPKITAGCGIDALSHGLEGCLSDVKVPEEDMRKSRECVKLVFENLPEVLQHPDDVERRQKLCLAAHYGGNAINKQLAGYVHAFAHTIGGAYHIAHGEAIARCLLPVMTYAQPFCTEEFRNLAVYCGFAEPETAADEAAECFLGKLSELLTVCGFSGGCDRIRTEDYPQLVKDIDADSVNYSPVKTLTDREVRQLLDEIKRGRS